MVASTSRGCKRLGDTGFLDDNLAVLDGFDYAPGVVGSAAKWTPEYNQVFVCGIGQLDVKKSVCAGLIEKGATFLTLIHQLH